MKLIRTTILLCCVTLSIVNVRDHLGLKNLWSNQEYPSAIVTVSSKSESKTKSDTEKQVPSGGMPDRNMKRDVERINGHGRREDVSGEVSAPGGMEKFGGQNYGENQQVPPGGTNPPNPRSPDKKD